MKRASLAVACGLIAFTVGVSAQQRTPAEILSDLERIIIELRAALPQPVPEPEPEPTPPTTVHVRDGENLQDALTSAAPGAILELDPVTFTGNFVARKPVTIRTRGLVLADKTVDEADRARMARIVTVNNAAALQVPPSGADVRLERVHFEGPANDVVMIGALDGQTTLAQVPRRVHLDQVSIAGPGAKNGLSFQAAESSITRSLIADVARLGVESHGIVASNTPGPLTIERNRILGSAIGIFFGGADPRIVPPVVPSDLVVRGNIVEKHPDWRLSSADGNGDGIRDDRNYSAKNDLECKACARLLVEDNTFGGTPAGGQAGWTIVFTPSQETAGPGPWAIVEAVRFRRNTVRRGGGIFNILGHGQYQTVRPTLVSRQIDITDNFFTCDKALGGHGALAQIGTGPIDLHIGHNTIDCNGDAMIRTSDTVPVPGFRFTNNLHLRAGTYGFYLSGGLTRGVGASTVSPNTDVRFPGAVIQGNALILAHPVMRTNLPLNTYIALCSWVNNVPCPVPIGLMVDGYGAGEAAAYGRRR